MSPRNRALYLEDRDANVERIRAAALFRHFQRTHTRSLVRTTLGHQEPTLQAFERLREDIDVHA